MALNSKKQEIDMMPSCQRCGREAVPVTLAGGYLAVLCIVCRNDWAVYVRKTQEFRERQKLSLEYEVKMSMLVGGNPGFDKLKIEDVVNSGLAAKDAEWKLREFAKLFADQKIDVTVDTEDGLADESGPVTKLPIGEDNIEDLLADGSLRDDPGPEGPEGPEGE
jgi:hypothetical protein